MSVGTSAMKNKLSKLFAFISLSAFSFSVLATQCPPDNSRLYFDYDYDFNSNQNYSGYTTPWRELSLNRYYDLPRVCRNKRDYYTTLKASPGLIEANQDGNGRWFDISENDYLQVAMQVYIGGGRKNYFDVPQVVDNQCRGRCTNQVSTGSRVKVRLKIKKKFVGQSFIVNREIGEVHIATEPKDGPSQPLVVMRLNAVMTVPQSCTFDVGDVIEFDFGEIPTSAFSSAGAGNRVEGKIKTQNIGIECKNIAAQEMMTARLEVTNPNQNIIVSNNPDVGFQLADKDNNVLVPNNMNSRIPFKLDQNAKSNFILKGWPVSITGNRPTAGPVNAEGHVRIDFD